MASTKHTHPLSHPGTVQTGRMPESLPPGKTVIDGRSRAQLLKYLVSIAKEAGYFNHNNPVKNSDGNFLAESNWQELLKDLKPEALDAWATTGTVPPHLVLPDLLTNLYEHPRRLLNYNVKRHLDFYYHEVLHLQQTPPKADKIHAVFELKKNNQPTLLPAGTLLNGAKDGLGKSLEYATTHNVIVSTSAVQQVQGFFIGEQNPDELHFAPIANSADGLGAKLPKDDPRWDAFGNDTWPLASVGFALASPVLRMTEGNRTVTVTLEITGLAAGTSAKAIENSFDAALTGPKGWISKGNISSANAGGTTTTGTNVFVFSISLTDKDPAVADYDSVIHGNRYLHTMPVLQLMLNNRKSSPGYQFWKNAAVSSATIDVEVKDISSLQVATETGNADAKKPFFPFGPTAAKHAACNVNCPEAFNKILKEITLTVSWKNIPAANVGSYYSAYGLSNNNQFTAYTSFEDGGKWKYSQSQQIFENDARQDKVFHFVNPDYSPPLLQFIPWFEPVKPVYNLSPGEPLLQKVFGVQQFNPAPFVFPKQNILLNVQAIRIALLLFNPSTPKKQGINLQLNRGFYFKEYRALLAATVANFSKTDATTISLPNEPFAPEVKSLKLDYKATSGKVSLSGTFSLFTGIGDALHYYHVGPFGVRHEQPAARFHLRFVQSSGVTLLPQYNNSGECYIGISGIKALDEITLLLQVSEGSANPLKKRTAVGWHVLANNYWRKLGDRELIFDTSEGLITSGIVRIILPADATTVNTWMTDGLIWLRASVQHDNDAVCRMVDVKPNAAIALLNGSGYDMAHFGSTLPAGSTTKMVSVAPAIKAVTQPYAGFGGRNAESEPQFYTRISERLRHKQRAISAFDIERLVLQQFPSLYMVNAIQHSNGYSIEAAGETQVVLVPDMNNSNAPNPLQPRADIYTLESVKNFLESLSSAWVTYTLSNPKYQPMKVSAGIRLRAGFAFGFYRGEIEKALLQFLSPWIGGNAGRFRFGGRVTASQVVNFLENLPYIDYISDLQLFHAVDGTNFGGAVNDIVILDPAGVLTSSETHTLNPI
ncbi:hypothetical protein BH10BAC3_BH10BAC3_08470 [soil metagenome]